MVLLSNRYLKLIFTIQFYMVRNENFDNIYIVRL